MRTGVIKEFRGENYFLSNYYTAPMEWRGIEFTSGEQAFAYAKTFFNELNGDSVRERILKATAPGDAKKLGGRQFNKIDAAAWDERKVQYMREIVHAKFQTATGLAGRLINTGACMLVEGNNWNDKFWGRCLDTTTGKMVGLNTLGVILMEERGWWSRGDLNRPN